MVICPACGHAIMAEERTCPACGWQVSATSPRTVPRWESSLVHAGFAAAIGGVLGIIAGGLKVWIDPIPFGFVIVIRWGAYGSLAGTFLGAVVGAAWLRR
jgi:hypothetical protein